MDQPNQWPGTERRSALRDLTGPAPEQGLDEGRRRRLRDRLEAEDGVALSPALAMLDEREQKIISLRFYGNLTQSEIADQVGISQMHVSRLLTKALAKLRKQMDAS